jgi:hypothetical protein
MLQGVIRRVWITRGYTAGQKAHGDRGVGACGRPTRCDSINDVAADDPRGAYECCGAAEGAAGISVGTRSALTGLGRIGALPGVGVARGALAAHPAVNGAATPIARVRTTAARNAPTPIMRDDVAEPAAFV